MSPLAELARAVPVTGGIALAAMTLAVLRNYARADRRRHHLLARHVWLIATSYLAFVAAAVAEAVTRAGTPLTWRAWIHGTGTLTGLAALIAILLHLRRKGDGGN